MKYKTLNLPSAHYEALQFLMEALECTTPSEVVTRLIQQAAREAGAGLKIETRKNPRGRPSTIATFHPPGVPFMPYPTLEEIEAADRLTLARWNRFLPSPGAAAIGTEDFKRLISEQGPLMDRIYERLGAFGGTTAEISKQIGW